MSYSLRQFGHMIADEVRMDAFARAITAAVRPGDVVLDIGTGTGVFALLACQAGARHVYAVDDTPWIETGPAFAAANGVADRITFLRGLTTLMEPPEQVDVVLGDIRGRLPGFDLSMAAYQDARDRWLRPGGRVIPRRDRVMVAALHDPQRHAREVQEPWRTNRLGLDLSPGYDTLANSTLPANLGPEAVLLGQGQWLELDYETCRQTPTAGGVWVQASQSRTVEFLATWFDAELYDGIGFSNDPACVPRPQMYHQVLLPLAEPVAVEAGEHLNLQVRADAAAGDFLLTWSLSVHADRSGPARHSSRGSSFQSLPLAALASRATDHRPRLGDRARATSQGIDQLLGGASVGEVATTLEAAFPALLGSRSAALSFAADLAQRYGV